MITKNYKPKYTCWKPKTVREIIKQHKRRERRLIKQWIRTQDIRVWNRAVKKLTNWDFD